MEETSKVVPVSIEDLRSRVKARQLLAVYDTEHIDRVSIHKAMEARRELVKLQGENMRRWDWMYVALIKEYHQNMQDGVDTKRSLYYFNVLQEAFDFIIRMPPKEAEEIRDMFLGLVKSLHEYEFMMILDLEDRKLMYGDLWLDMMHENAEKLMELIGERKKEPKYRRKVGMMDRN